MVRELESTIERKLRREVEKAGGVAVKLNSTSMAGLPDRLVLWPGGRAVFVETKAPGKKMRKLQQFRADWLKALGFRVYAIDNEEGIRQFIGIEGR